MWLEMEILRKHNLSRAKSPYCANLDIKFFFHRRELAIGEHWVTFAHQRRQTVSMKLNSAPTEQHPERVGPSWNRTSDGL